MLKLAILLSKIMMRLTGRSLLTAAYNDMGILNYQNQEVSGENYLIEKALKKYVTSKKSPVFFDIGANVGEFSLLLRESWPDAEISAFEPNLRAYEQLVKATSGQQIHCFNIGLGKTTTTQTLYVNTANPTSEHATIHKEIHADIYHVDSLDEVRFEMLTLDQFCSEHGINSIEFLKIDTEGNEIAVLEGAAKMLAADKISLIQFEFGECHVFSRTFIRDFYQLLAGFQFFRLGPKRLIPMGKYSVANEIFRFQNIIAIHPSIKVFDKHP